MQSIPPGPADQRDLLAGLAREFPAFEFNAQQTWRGTAFTATARAGTSGDGIYALVTRDPAELRVTLSSSASAAGSSS